MGVVLEDQLLQVQKRPLVVYFLSNLDGSLPHVLGGQSGAVRALSVGNHVFDLKNLLENRGGENLSKTELDVR